MLNRTGLLCVCIAWMAFASCRDLKEGLWDEVTPPEPCDAASNVYLGERHFLDRDFVRDDGTLDYERYLRLREPRASPCDPIYGKTEAEVRSEFDEQFSVLRGR